MDATEIYIFWFTQAKEFLLYVEIIFEIESSVTNIQSTQIAGNKVVSKQNVI